MSDFIFYYLFMGKLTRFFGNWIVALKTFPIAHLILVFLTGYGFYLVNTSWTGDDTWKLFFAGFLGILLSLVGPLLTLHADGNEKKINFFSRGIQIFSLLFIGGYDWMLSRMSTTPGYAENLLYLGIFPLFMLGILTLIAWIFKSKENKIWFSWTSCLHAIGFGLLAGLIVWGGLSAAIGSINALFDVHFRREWYQYFGVFSLIFLAGSFMLNHYTFVVAELPKGSKTDFELLSTRLMRIFGSYIFLPLAMVYLLIFVAYGLKILITGMRPKGIIIWLGTGYFAWGMLTYYFTFPEQTKFFHWIRRVLFMSFILVALMMIGALGIRINQYGITINRYFVALLILFVVGFSALALFFSKCRIRLFISLLFGLTLLSLYGPLSARNVAFFAQKSRIETMLAREQLALPLQKNALKDLTGAMADQLAETISDFVRTFPYQQRNQVLFNNQYSGGASAWSYGYEVCSYLGAQDYYGTWEDKEESKKISFSLSVFYDFFEKEGIVTDGYAKIYEMNWLDPHITNNKLSYTISGERKSLDLTPYLEDIYLQSTKGKEWFSKDWKPFIIDQGDYRLIIYHLEGEKWEDGKIVLEEYLQGYLLMK